MKKLIYLSFLLLVACATPIQQPQPQSVYAKQIGLQDIDTTSAWTYMTVVHFANGDSTKFSQIHTVKDTATILGNIAYKVEVSTPFGSYDYKIRTDSTGLWVERLGVVNHYQYPVQDTFTINQSCGLLSEICNSDTSITYYGRNFPNTVAYHTWVQPCSNADSYIFYKYGIGLVASVAQNGGETTVQYLIEVR